jgi:SAM-dependent methyltransferase
MTAIYTDRCPSCHSTSVSLFYEVEQMPVNSVLLLSTREEALRFPTGRISLGFCQACGFVSNLAFDAGALEYSARYESTQSYSQTFNAFAKQLAQRLVDQYDLHDKTIVEIGCGQGEFLELLCELGPNRGIGFDPAYVAERNQRDRSARLRFVPDYYSEEHADTDADFVCCKMTLEHIHSTHQFVSTVRRSLRDRTETVVFFQIPNLAYILRDNAFWDIYYEHCSYFSPGSLARLFRATDFRILNLGTAYEDQYLMIEAAPGVKEDAASLPLEEEIAVLQTGVEAFATETADRLKRWQSALSMWGHAGSRVALWGGGSKAVSFLTTLNVRDQIEYAVDINPRKHGTFLAMTGQEIVAPEFLREYQPEIIIVMNPIYCREIQDTLNQLGVSAQLLPIDGELPHE